MTTTYQGQSASTADKERGIAATLAVTMRIAVPVIRRARRFRNNPSFYFLDTNCGSGFNAEVDVPGSPLAFHVVADSYLGDVPRVGFFCDVDPDRLYALKRNLRGGAGWSESSSLLRCDNEGAVEAFAEYIKRTGENPRWAMGAIVVDPNGWFYRNAKQLGPPVGALTEFFRQFQAIDVILNLNLSAYLRQRNAPHCNNVPPAREVFRLLNKKYWLVKSIDYARTKFLLVVGRNMETRDYRALGFFDADSREGCDILALAEDREAAE